MTKDDYFKQNTECRATGIATRGPWGDSYLCGKSPGTCSMMKCVTIHNNGALSCAEIQLKNIDKQRALGVE